MDELASGTTVHKKEIAKLSHELFLKCSSLMWNDLKSWAITKGWKNNTNYFSISSSLGSFRPIAEFRKLRALVKKNSLLNK